MKLENRENVSPIAILEEEIKLLKELNAKHSEDLQNKKVVKKEEGLTKTRYYLKDGSVYVVKGKDFRYLYDSKSKIITYEFESGQIERTFSGGLKEIRRKDGSIVIKNGQKEYDHLC